MASLSQLRGASLARVVEARVRRSVLLYLMLEDSGKDWLEKWFSRNFLAEAVSSALVEEIQIFSH